MEQLKHECGVAMIRLLKPLSYYEQKYGTWRYGLNKLYLMMEKQHNRGQEGAGVACVNLDAPAGEEYMFRERAEGKDAITEGSSTSISRLLVNSIWAICAIPPQVRAACNMCIPSCVVTTGAPRTSVCVVTSI